MGLRRDDSGLAGVPDDDVCVGTDRDAALLGVDVEDLGCVGAGDGHEAGSVHLAGVHSLFPNNRHAVLDAVYAVGDLGEVVAT